MTIIRCNDAHRDPWNIFVQGCPTASLYHRFEWRDVNHKCFGHRSAYLAAIDNQRIVGVYPIVQVKSWLFGNIACSMPFVNYGGPCGEHEQIERELLEAGRVVADEWGVDYLEIRSMRKLGDEYPTSDHKVSMTVQLSQDSEALWKAFSTGHRQDIRRGYKKGFVARFGKLDLLDDFYPILCESWRDLGTPIYRKSYLETLLHALPDCLNVCVLYCDGEPAAAALDGFHSGVGEGLWLGTRAKYRRDMAGYVLYWELLKHACENGLLHFHLGRTTVQSGAQAFKKKWNAFPTQLYWHYMLRRSPEIPKLNVDNPRYRAAISAWQRLPVPITQVIGPFIARSIP